MYVTGPHNVSAEEVGIFLVPLIVTCGKSKLSKSDLSTCGYNSSLLTGCHPKFLLSFLLDSNWYFLPLSIYSIWLFALIEGSKILHFVSKTVTNGGTQLAQPLVTVEVITGTDEEQKVIESAISPLLFILSLTTSPNSFSYVKKVSQ